jgi:hypothetical protein
MTKASVFVCEACGQHSSQWAGRVRRLWRMGCDRRAGSGAVTTPLRLADRRPADRAGLRGAGSAATGLPDLDRVLGGGLVPGSVVLLAGPPGIGKSTLLLQWLAAMAAVGQPVCSSRARNREPRSPVAPGGSGCAATPSPSRRGATSHAVLAGARAERPTVLAVDSIQTLRDRRPRPAGRGGPGPRLRRCRSSSWQDRRHHRRRVWPRDQGRRSGGPGRSSTPSTSSHLRGGPSVGPADRLGGKEPVRGRGRDGLVRDGTRRAGADRPGGAALLG